MTPPAAATGVLCGRSKVASASGGETVEETEALSVKNKHPQEEKRTETNTYTGRRRPRIARVLLDSSASAQYPDWMKEELQKRIQEAIK